MKDEKGFKPQEDVDVFMSVAGQPLRYEVLKDADTMFDEDQAKLYMDLVTEEYEIIRVDSLSGSVWIALNLKQVENPKYFFNKESVDKWLV